MFEGLGITKRCGGHLGSALDPMHCHSSNQDWDSGITLQLLSTFAEDMCDRNHLCLHFIQVS